MSILDKVAGKIGIGESEEEKQLREELENEERTAQEEEDEAVEDEEPRFVRPRQEPPQNVVNFQAAASARSEAQGNVKIRVIVIEPKNFDDAQQVANNLREKKPVVINFENTDAEDARRIIDFISGTTYALNGEIRKVGHNVFLCAPSNVNVTFTEEERRVSSEMPWLKK